MTTATLRRLGLAFRISWFLRGIPVLLILAGCAPVKRCEFPLWVTVTPDADVRDFGEQIEASRTPRALSDARSVPAFDSWKEFFEAFLGSHD